MLVCYWYVRITNIYVKQYADSVDLVGIKLLYCPCWYVPIALKSPPCRNKEFLRYKIWDYLLTLKREILLVWPSNWGTVKVLFLINRYLPFFDVPLALVGQS